MMLIRLAAIEDVESIRILYEDFFAYNASQQPQYYKKAKSYVNYPESVVKSDSEDIYIAIDDDQVVGMIHVSEDHTPPFETFIPQKFANVIDLYVCPEYRKRGIGIKLMNAASQWAKNKGLDYIELNVLSENENAIEFYEHLNYEKVSHIMRLKI